MRFIIPAAAAALLGASTAHAADLSVLDDPSLGKNRYERCLELVKRSAATAVDQANGWYADGGGAAAMHCSALGLVELKRFGEAAQKLEQAARQGASGMKAQERAALLDQAGNAWLLDNQSARAESALTAALSFAPQDEDVLADRARARGLRKDWSGAEADLSALLSLDPDRADALVLRASARHAQGRRIDARTDIDHALDVDPAYPEALLERGNLKAEDGDSAGARADWQQVLSQAPGSDAAATAAARLRALSPAPPKH